MTSSKEGPEKTGPSNLEKPELDDALLGFKTSKLEPFLNHLKAGENLDILQVIGRQILERATSIRKSMISDSRIEQLKVPSSRVVAQASLVTKNTISKVIPVKKIRKAETKK